MNGNDLNLSIELLAKILTGKGVFIISGIIALVLYIYYIKNKSRGILNILPGLCTSLGLLGTFVAICNSLGDIREENLQIDKIIRDLIPAFTSSIAGLVCSFISTIFIKIIYSYEDIKLEKKMKSKSPEICLYQMTEKLSDIKQLFIEQNEKNREYNDKLNTTISQQSNVLQRFVDDFVTKMDDIFEKMHGQIEQNIKDFGEEQFQKCAQTLEGLTSKLSSLSVGMLEQQKESVQTMIDETNNELKFVSDNVTEQMDALCTQVTMALSSLQTNQNERLTSIISNYDSLSETLVQQNFTFAENMNTQLNVGYEKMQQHSADSLQQMVDLKDAYKEVNEEMLQNTTELNREVSLELRSSLSNIVAEIQKNIDEQVKVFGAAITQNVQSLEHSYTYISEHVANIKGNYESAAQSFSDSVNHTHRLNETQEHLLCTMRESMLKVGKTNEKVDEVIGVLDQRQERIENLMCHINEISTTIEVLQKLESQLNRITTVK